MFSGLIAKQCSREVSVYGMMLQRHIFKIVETFNTLECLTACNDLKRCQSFNYVVSKNICEMNNRTKEARPEDFVPDSDRYYYGRVRNRGLLLVREREKVKHFEREMLTFLLQLKVSFGQYFLLLFIPSNSQLPTEMFIIIQLFKNSLYIYLFICFSICLYFLIKLLYFFLRLSSVNHPQLSVSSFRKVVVNIFLSLFSSTGIHSRASF